MRTSRAGVTQAKLAGGLAALCVAVAVVAADQISKALILASEPGRAGTGWLTVRLVRNTGASYGIGAGHPLLITLVAAAVTIIAFGVLSRTRSRPVALCLAAVVGGAVSNLADRVFRSPGFGRGAVVDWIHVAGYAPSFNIADVAIRLGAVGAIIAALAWRRPRLASQT
jgi:signal peptidase II